MSEEQAVYAVGISVDGGDPGAAGGAGVAAAAADVAAVAAPAVAAAVDASAAELLSLAREALIAAHPDAVAELIVGATAGELRSSVPLARAAYARIAEAERASALREVVPAGGGSGSGSAPAEVLRGAAAIRAAVAANGVARP